ncbi:MAG: class I SAM-dependent methyltransferase [Oscillospiraceae bacterium]|nr:class I SAM-dependent methyltransferase [Oscillospiraceae bacterium]
MDLNMKTESERQWALQMFNENAENYDKYEPNYPEALVETIINKANLTSGSKLLEIGSGNGRATAQFANFGFEIVCIEPGIDMIEKAKAKLKDKNIKFIHSRFEDYAAPSEYFDAVISAQAFHWVSQPLGYEICSKTLKKSGYLAPFWYIELFGDSDLDRELWAIIEKYNAYVSCMREADYANRMEAVASKIVSSGLFSKPKIIHSCLDKNYMADDYFNYLDSHGVFDKQPDEVKQACCEELLKLSDKYNGIKRHYTCELYLTQKI